VGSDAPDFTRMLRSYGKSTGMQGHLCLLEEIRALKVLVHLDHSSKIKSHKEVTK
jgi:hypothetical protein